MLATTSIPKRPASDDPAGTNTASLSGGGGGVGAAGETKFGTLSRMIARGRRLQALTRLAPTPGFRLHGKTDIHQYSTAA
jgi:hypothetical protein